MRTFKTIFATAALSLALSIPAIAASAEVSVHQPKLAASASAVGSFDKDPLTQTSTNPAGYYCYYDYVYVCNAFGCEYVYRYICI